MLYFILKLSNFTNYGKRFSSRAYLQASTKSALWLGPTYLYSARASQTISRNVSLRTNAVVRLLYNSNGILLLWQSFPKSKWLPKSVLSRQIAAAAWPSLFTTFPLEAWRPDKTIASGCKPSIELPFLVSSNTLWLIW